MNYDNQIYYPDEIRARGSLLQEKISPFGFLVAPFIILAVSIAAVPGLNTVVIIVGAILSAAFLISLVRGQVLLSREVLLLALFIIWGFFGLFVAVNLIAFYYRLWTMVQILMMVLIIASSSLNLKTARYFLLAFLVGCGIIVVSAFMTGTYALAETGEERAAGLAMNANTLAFTMFYAATALLYFFASWKNWIFKLACVGALLAVGKIIIATGSREGFFSFILMAGLWFFFNYRKQVFRYPMQFLFAGIAVAVVLVIFFMSVADTIMAQRIQESRGITESDLTRWGMYIAAFRITLQNPLTGVGFDNFSVVSSFGTYAHSNYMELMATTGLLGFIIYYLIFFYLWLRFWRLGKLQLDPKAVALINTVKAFMLVRLAGDLSRVSYFQKVNWIFLAIIIGWSYSLERQIVSQVNAQFDNGFPEESDSEGRAIKCEEERIPDANSVFD